MLKDLLLVALFIENLMEGPLPKSIIIRKSHSIALSHNALFLPSFFRLQWANSHPNLDHLLVHLFDYNEQ